MGGWTWSKFMAAAEFLLRIDLKRDAYHLGFGLAKRESCHACERPCIAGAGTIFRNIAI